MKRGTIVLTPFPFTDLKGQKVRPAIVISPYSSHSDDVIIEFISSVIIGRNLTATDHVFRNTDMDFKATGLKVDSVFRMAKLVTVEKRILIGELGKASPRLMRMLDDCLLQALGLR